MKKLLVIAVLLLSGMTASAQTSGFSIKAGAGFANFAGSDVSGNKAKFNWKLGVGYEIPIADNFFVEPSLMFNSKGDKYSGKVINLSYLELPIMLGYRVAAGDNMNVVFNAGPYLAYGLGGTNDPFKGDNSMRKFDFGLGCGVKYEISQFVVGLDFSYGLNKLYKDSKSYNITYGLTLGYK